MTVSHHQARWLRGVSAPDARIRLVCFPHAGGAAGFFQGWDMLTPPGLQILAVQYPGRQDRFAEPCATTMEELADAVTAALRQELSDGPPLALFGHSMGSAVAYEVARRLEDVPGLAPTHLIVSGRARPRTPQELPPYPRPTDSAILDRVRLLDPENAHVYDIPELLPVVMPPLRADFGLLATHRPSRLHRLGIPVTAYGGDRDPACTRDDLGSWSDVTTAGTDVRLFEGNHFYLNARKHEVLAHVTEVLRVTP